MGTRSLIHVIDKGRPLMTIYTQYDGYPDGVGLELYNFLQGRTLVNGLSIRNKKPVFNGMGDLAAWLVKNQKQKEGNVYIYPAGSKDCGEEYVYYIYAVGEDIKLKCTAVYDERILFDKFVKDLTSGDFND